MSDQNREKLSRYAQLLAVLRSFEQEIGLDDYSPIERSILAVLSINGNGSGMRAIDIINSSLMEKPTNSSFYRALKNLRQHGAVESVGGLKTGAYKIAKQSGMR